MWSISLDVPVQEVLLLRALLDPDELRRADGFDDPARRRRHTVSHGVTRRLLGSYLSVPPRSLRWTRGPHGKPAIAGSPDTSFSLSHSGDRALLGVAAGRSIGVDVEAEPAFDADAFAARFFPASERALVAAGQFTRLWSRKEACVKAAGGRLVQGLPLLVGGETVHDPSGALPGPWLVRDVPVPQGFGAAVALSGTEPCALTVH
ncbi:4'-phosphopantetheinyl transferase superfamily protein [Spirillospora sp. NPDC052269]